ASLRSGGPGPPPSRGSPLRGGVKERLEEMAAQVPDRRRDDPVPSQVIGVVVAGWQTVIVGKPHEPRGLARRDQPRAQPRAFDKKQELPAGAAGRRAQTARKPVETRLGALALLTGSRIARAPIDGADHRPAGRVRRGESLAIGLVHQRDERARFLLRAPRHVARARFDELGEREIALMRRGQPPPHPAAPRRFRQAPNRGPEPWRMKGPGWILHRQGGGWRKRRLRRDDEEPRPGLRQEERRVDDERAEAIALLRQRVADRGEILAAVGGQGSADVFEGEQARRAAFFTQAPHEIEEGPEGPAALARKPRAAAGEREILTGEGRPNEIGDPGQLRRADLPHVAEEELVVAPIG